MRASKLADLEMLDILNTREEDNRTQKHERTRWENGRAGLKRIELKFVSEQILGERLSHHPANQTGRIADRYEVYNGQCKETT